jgi:hypothetical protein
MHVTRNARIRTRLVWVLALVGCLSLVGATGAAAADAVGGGDPPGGAPGPCGAFAQGYIARASQAGSQGVHFVLEAIRADGPVWYASGDLSAADPESLTGIGAPGTDPVNVSVTADGAVLLEFPGNGGSTTTISVASCGWGVLHGFADGTDTLYVLSLQDNPPLNP